MAKLTNGILGPVLGKMGPIVGSSWKGESYIKSQSRPRTKKRGVGEQINQNKFASLHYWLNPIIDFLRAGFKEYTPRVEGFNAAKSYCLKHAFVEENGIKVLDPARIQVSYGDLPLPSDVGMNKSGDYTLQFTWDTNIVEGASQYDQVMLLAYDSKKKKQSMNVTGQFRSTGADTLILEQKTGLTYHVYIAFTAHDRSRQSHSVYLGTVDI